ncbi:MAG: nucleotidyl transferase AbiEii/AbiGii toxin family protein [Chitinispirillales bacterium]|jgi:predicted nucleotidyltransferase|nr:nucleotidyl transferase AbiEii/AbiGii toxin family protein [Chitinispirillales bacterium]
MSTGKEMLLKEDFYDILHIFNEESVQYMVVGGLAAILHGYSRFTKDIDLLVWPNQENAIRVMKALEKFGAPMHDISAADFEKEGTVFQIGIAPVRIDIITAVAEVNFKEAYQRAQMTEIDGLKVPLISIPDLIRNKKAAGRGQDLVDVEHLEVILKRKTADEK